MTINKGNIVSRIGRLRQQRFMAVCVAVFAIGIAIAGWRRPPQAFTEHQMIVNSCEQWCASNNSKETV